MFDLHVYPQSIDCVKIWHGFNAPLCNEVKQSYILRNMLIFLLMKCIYTLSILTFMGVEESVHRETNLCEQSIWTQSKNLTFACLLPTCKPSCVLFSNYSNNCSNWRIDHKIKYCIIISSSIQKKCYLQPCCFSQHYHIKRQKCNKE